MIIYSAVTNANLQLPDKFKTSAEQEITEGLWKRLVAVTPYSYWTNLALNPELIAERATRKKEIKSNS